MLHTDRERIRPRVAARDVAFAGKTLCNRKGKGPVLRAGTFFVTENVIQAESVAQAHRLLSGRTGER